MTMRTFDCVVIGSGPAGLAAATAIAKAGCSVATLDRMGPGGQLMNLGVLQGVPDVEPGTMGPDLIARLAEAAMTAGVELVVDDVQSVNRAAGASAGRAVWTIVAVEGTFAAKALVVAAGLTPGTTGLAEEEQFEGRGLSHCANCDAPLFAGRPVLVVGHDAWAVEEAIELAAHAAAVTLVLDADCTAEVGRRAVLDSLANARLVRGRVTGLAGTPALQSAEVTHADGTLETIPAEGLFPVTGRIPARAFLPPAIDAAGGLFWAGDIRPGATQSIPQAIADGVGAGHNALAWVTAGPSV